MSIALALRDESTMGHATNEIVIEFPTEKITVRELIRNRVYQEVHEYNEKEPEYFRGLVAPSDAENTLNGYKLKKNRKIDWRVQYRAVIEGFEKQRYVLLIDDHQVESLREEVLLSPQTKISFLKLVPLVGG
jgi:hypothetical protein